MARCIAFVPAEEFAEAWMPCDRQAETGRKLCSVHRESVDGVILGMEHKKNKEEAARRMARRARAIERELQRQVAADGEAILCGVAEKEEDVHE
jgi:hypothetical protein